MYPVSILDLSYLTSGASPSLVLRRTLDLARLADRLGFRRFWLAEHHNVASVVSPAPDIMIGQIAGVTHRLRVGAGGVMLLNHAPLMVAERFKLLEALFPGRIDLGLGRAPGTDHVTAFALRHRPEVPGDQFLEYLRELIQWESGAFPDGHPFRHVHASPTGVPLPPLWLLGSSDHSAVLAASLGIGFAFSHHLASHDAAAAMLDYRSHYKLSRTRPLPYAILMVAAICADTDAEAEKLAASADLSFVWREHGRYLPLPSPEEALAYHYTPHDLAGVRRSRQRLLVGSPATLRPQLVALLKATQADELMVASAIFDHEARKHSYTLIGRIFGHHQTPEPVAHEAVPA
jgi:luciferase family oxidoreductase group 1